MSFDFNVAYSSRWGYSLINTLNLKKKWNWTVSMSRSGTKMLRSPRPQLAPSPPHQRLHSLQATPVVRCAESRCRCSSGASVGVQEPSSRLSAQRAHSWKRAPRFLLRQPPKLVLFINCYMDMLSVYASADQSSQARAHSSSEDNKLSTQARNNSSVVSWVSLLPIPNPKKPH